MAQIDQIQKDLDNLITQVDTLTNQDSTDFEQLLNEKLEDYPDISQVSSTYQITINAVFDDGGNADGLRPLGINAKVMIGEDVYKTVILNPSNDFMVTVDMPLDYYATVTITSVASYTFTVDETENKFTITLYH
jgi:flagellin-like hook-associated protein FlgL